jgi:glutamyl-tRNA synthetase
MSVRVRFAPSPTGYLHIGGARTALFNWLFARGNNGTFILRIEDTDAVRSTDESVSAIIDSMKWLGLDWDEGPIFQSDRRDIHKKYAEQLISEGKAYYDFNTPDENKELVEKARAAGLNKPNYFARWKDLTEDEIKTRIESGQKYAIRFHVPDGVTIIHDLIKGDVRTNHEQVPDFAMMKSDGTAVFNFACAIDDHEMGMTHVIRGDDHLSNCPKQTMIYEAFGWDIPIFAHLPLILAPDKSRLSKRHGAVSVGEYRNTGFLPEAVNNYLALLGWSFNDRDEIFHMSDLIEKFSLEKVGKTGATFDQKKMEWMNGIYIREATPGHLALTVKQYLPEFDVDPANVDEQYLISLCELEQVKAKSMVDMASRVSVYLKDTLDFNEKDVNKFLKKPGAKALLQTIRDGLADVEPFEHDPLEKVFQEAMEKLELKMGKVAQPVRVALTGSTASAGIYDVILFLGKERSLTRLDAAIAELAEE